MLIISDYWRERRARRSGPFDGNIVELEDLFELGDVAKRHRTAAVVLTLDICLTPSNVRQSDGEKREGNEEEQRGEMGDRSWYRP